MTQENEKTINPNLRIDSNELVEKARISLRECGMFTIHWLHEDFDLDTVKELFKLDTDFVRGHCPACDGYWYAFKSSHIPMEEDSKGLCVNCGELLVMMVVLKIPKERIGDWIKSEGKNNPLELLKEFA